MSTEIVVMAADGQFRLSDYGEFVAYGRAYEKLISSLLAKFQSIGEKQRKVRLQAATTYIQQNVKNIDDYLDHIPHIAKAMGIKPDILTKFVGNHLAGLVEKKSDELRVQELEKIRILKDPDHTITDELFTEITDPIVKAGEILFNRDGTIPTEDEKKEQQPAINLGAQNDPPAMLPPDEVLTVSEMMLAEIGPELAQVMGMVAPPIVLGKGHENSHLPAIVAKQVAENMPQDQGAAAEVALPVQAEIGPPPSEEMFAQVGTEIFVPNGTMNLEQTLEQIADKKKSAEAGPAAANPVADVTAEQIDAELAKTKAASLITFEDYYKVIQKLTQFQKKGDNAGYKQWLNGGGAAPMEKAIISVRNQVNAEKKGQTVDWATVNNNMANLLGKLPNDVTSLKDDIKSFETARLQLSRLQKRVLDHCAKSKIDARPHFRNIHADLVRLFEKRDTADSKKRSLKMTLLKVEHSGVAKVIEKAAHQEFEILKETYGLG